MKEKRKIDNEISLVPYYEDYETTLKWYQDKDVCKQVDNIDRVYDLDLLSRMYNYLNSNGDLYYIEYNENIVGDVTLLNDGTLAIVVSKEYQNKHIGRRVINEIIVMAKEKKLPYLHAEIFSFNRQSEKMFLSCGFKKENLENYYYRFDNEK